MTDWTDWSNASTVSLDWNEVTFNTTINNYYTGVVDVGLPDSENKLYKEGITATGIRMSHILMVPRVILRNGQ